jgi:hypothetical protein
MTEAEQRMLDEMFGPGVTEHPFEGRRAIALPRVVLPNGCDPGESSAIYIVGDYQGYPTRLYLETPVKLKSGAVPSTSAVVLFGRTMYAASINEVPTDLPLYQGILAHLERYALAS